MNELEMFSRELAVFIQKQVKIAVKQELSNQADMTDMADTKIQSEQSAYLNLGESAKFLSISRGTLTKLINHGDLKLIKFGKAKRLSKKRLIEFMEERQGR